MPTVKRPQDELSIGDVSRRSGLAASALRYYESIGLIASARTAGDRRRYPRSVLRRLAVIRSAQSRGDIEILSRPVLIAANNVEATFMVGSQRPFISVSRSLPN